MKTPGRWSSWWAELGRRARRGRAKPGPARPTVDPFAEAIEERPAPGDLAHAAELEAIRQVDEDDPASRARALELLRSAAGTSLEHQALAACLSAHGRRRAPAELLCVAAELLTRRGDVDAALGLLEGLEEPRGWLLEADLRAERGQHAAALTLVERALAHSIDAPGALERVQRLAPGKRVAPGANQPTLLAPRALHPSLRILGEGGRGGAATVYRAEDTTLGRALALKVYHRPERCREQLLREARMAVRFSGDGVVRVFDVEPDAGWIAMEWAAGGSLRQCLQKTPSETPPVDLMLPALVRTLARIHGAGYVHADVKPGNILFRADHAVLLSDFGLSVPLGAQHLGQSGGYTSPERSEGGVAVAADDVYALGCVLGEVLEAGAPCSAPAAWRKLAMSLTGPGRPADAGAVLELLPTLHGNR